MKITFLLKRLTTEGYEFQYSGLERTDIYAVHTFEASVQKPNVLYIMIEGSMNVTQIQPYVSYICVNSERELENILEQIDSYLMADYRRNMALQELCFFQKEIHFNYRKLAELLYEIMWNPVVLTNRKGVMVDHRGFRGEDEYEKFIQTDPCQKSVIYVDGEMFTLSVFDKSHSFDKDYDGEYFELIKSLFYNKEHRKMKETNQEYYEFVINVIENRFFENHNDRLVRQMLPEKRRYYFLVLESLENIREGVAAVEKVLDAKSIFYNGYFVFLLSSDIEVEYDSVNFPDIEEILKKYDMRAALSYGFLNIARGSFHYRQSIEVLQISKSSTSIRMNFFGRYYFRSLINKVIPHMSKEELLSYCSPKLVYLFQAERKDKDELIEALLVTVAFGGRIREAAETMHIHFNTLYRRLDILEEEFDIHLKNPAEFTRILFSTNVLYAMQPFPFWGILQEVGKNY